MDANGAQPADTSGEVSAFPDDQSADVELADQSATVPARSQSRDHNRVAIGTPPACVAEGIGLSMRGGVAMLDAAIAAGTEQPSIDMEESGADRDPALGKSDAGFVDRDREHLPIAKQQWCRDRVDGNCRCS